MEWILQSYYVKEILLLDFVYMSFPNVDGLGWLVDLDHGGDDKTRGPENKDSFLVNGCIHIQKIYVF